MPLSLINLQQILINKNYQFSDIDVNLSNPDQLLKSDEYLIRIRADQLKEDIQLKDWLLRLVVDIKTQTIVGHVGFHNKPNKEGMVEFGITIGQSFKRNGFGQEAVRALCSWAINEDEVKLIRASVSPTNTASLALISKLGLARIGEQNDEIDGLENIFQLSSNNFPVIDFTIN